MFIFPTLHSNTYNHPKTGKCWKNCCFRVNFLTPCEFPNIWQSSLNGICHLLLLLHFVTISYTFTYNLPGVYKKMLQHFPFFCFRSLVMVSKHQQPMGFTRNVCFSLEMKKINFKQEIHQLLEDCRSEVNLSIKFVRHKTEKGFTFSDANIGTALPVPHVVPHLCSASLCV